jgi:hypothetical protein
MKPLARQHSLDKLLGSLSRPQGDGRERNGADGRAERLQYATLVSGARDAIILQCYRRNFPTDVMMDRSENLKPVWLVGL